MDTIIKRELIVIALLLLVILFFIFENGKVLETDELSSMKDFTPQTLSAGHHTEYDMKLKMEANGKFQVDMTVEIENTSGDSWDKLVFYFIPNIFTKETSEQLNNPLDFPGTVQIQSIAIEENPVEFYMEEDTLTIPLATGHQANNTIDVHFSYEFTLPENGLRFTKSGTNYHLAQFYPMLATYRDKSWNKEAYRFRGETYHTAFSDFMISYEIPDGYTFVSTSEDEKYPSQSEDTFNINHVKEVFIAIVKDPVVVETEVGNIHIRVFGFDKKTDLYEEIRDIAAESLQYFQRTIGPYPFKQLDIVVDGLGMEYPGIVTVGSIYGTKVNEAAIKNMVVHEIAHQWFYGVISNDPFNDAWLDEGLATFAESLFYFYKSGEGVPYEMVEEQLDLIEESSLPVNLPLNYYENSSHIYGKASSMLWLLFEDRGGKKEAERFLKSYYDLYKFKEVDTEEFVRFAQSYFNMEDLAEFDGWLEMER